MERDAATTPAPGVISALRSAVGRVRALFYRGDRVACPCCGGRFRAFASGGVRPRSAASCPRCGALERHRILWLLLEHFTDVYTAPHRLLHVAPEPSLASRLAAQSNIEYTSADLSSPHAMEHFDITDIPYPDATFSAILCCHVLEHVPDDARAIAELLRVLKPGGWAVLHTPIHHDLERTVEDPNVTDPEERRRRYGQPDHVRIYGRDFSERLAEGGFFVHRFKIAKRLGDQAKRYGLHKDEGVTVGTRPPKPQPGKLIPGGYFDRIRGFHSWKNRG
jgi:SAM-dependent methyltransferase